MNRGKQLSWFANFSATCRRLIKLLARFEPISQSSVYSMHVQVLTVMISGRLYIVRLAVACYLKCCMLKWNLKFLHFFLHALVFLDFADDVKSRNIIQIFLVMTMSFLLAGEDDLLIVRSAVASLAGRWKDLGISLGICLSDLDAIFSTNPQSPHDCLRETLALWLKQNYNVRTTLMLPHCTMCPLYESCITDHIIHFEYCIQSFTNSGIIIPWSTNYISRTQTLWLHVEWKFSNLDSGIGSYYYIK